MWVLIALLLTQFAISTALSALTLAHLRRMAGQPPQDWADRLDASQFPRMVAYATANTRLGHAARGADLCVILAILLSGLLPTVTRWATSLGSSSSAPGGRVWQGLIVLATPAMVSYLANVPWDLVSNFRVERKFGFSTITIKTWLMDQVKNLLISLVLGTLLGGGLLLLIGWLGRGWWIPAWILIWLFQLVMTFIAPVIILPLFSKFEPLQDRELSKQITALASGADLPLGGVFQVDASLRSTHSNAYFAGLGKTRRIALFDTLLDQHSQEQILAIVAHEIGHWKKRHVLRTIVAGCVVSGIGSALAATLLDLPWLYATIGVGELYMETGAVGPVAAVGMYLVGVLLSPLGLLLAPVATWFSQRHEHEADAYSLALYEHPTALEEALIQSSEKNLANLFPHPLVVIFRYSHPPLRERVAAIRARWAERQKSPDG